MKKNFAGAGVISIPDFIKAYVKDGGEEFWLYVRRWKNAYAVVERYRLAGNTRGMNDKLAVSVKKRGIQWFQDGERLYAARAYDFLVKLDRNYFAETGIHFKEYVAASTSADKERYMLQFMKAYNSYHARKKDSELVA